MRKQLTKIISVFLTLMIFVSALPLTADATTEYTWGWFYYTVSNGNARITGIDESYGITSLTIPDTIDGYTVTSFYLDDENIKHIDIPYTVTSISYNDLISAESLESIFVAPDNSNYSSVNGVLYNKSKTKLIAYPKGKADADFTIPDNVTDLGYQAFLSNDYIVNVTLSESVKNLEQLIFSGCSSLKNIIFSGNVTTIPPLAFGSCKSLTEISIPEGITSVASSAFDYCDNLKSVTISKSVTSLGDAPFDCGGLVEINVDTENEKYSSEDGVLYSKDKTRLIRYPAAKNDSSFDIPDGVTYIGHEAFANAKNLDTVAISAEVKETGTHIFYNSSLRTVKIPIALTVINVGMFKYCENLTDVYYEGSESDWQDVDILQSNDELLNANIYYNYCFHKNTIIIPAVKATCKSTGLTEGLKCAACGLILEKQLETPAADHSYTSEITSPATHLKEGVKTFTCVCGDSYTENIAKLETHTYTSEVTTPATHTSIGIMTYTCGCGDTYTEEIEKSADHSYNMVVSAPTCTERGYTTYICICGDSYVSDYVDEKGHYYIGTVTTPATHTSTGVITYTCVCGDNYAETIAKTEKHEYKADVTVPTCTERGYTTYICACGDSYVADYVSAKGHSYKGSVTASATHTSEGIMTYTCFCGDSYTEVIEKEAKHSYETEIIKEATHLENGIMKYTCVCGDTYTADIPTISGHTYKSEVIEEPECKKNGTKLFYCECGYSYTESIYMLGHIDEDDNDKCDRCSVVVCSHMCHKTGIMGFIWKIVLFFSKLFGLNPVCECGKSHY